MRTASLALVAGAVVAAFPLACQASLSAEDFETCTGGALAGQSGWYLAPGSGSSTAAVSPGSGPSLSGSNCVRLSNSTGTGVVLYKQIGNQVGTEKILEIRYDIRNVTNHTGVNPTTMRVRIADNSSGWQYMPPIDNFHYDGGGGPACQARVSDGQGKNIWATGGPSWQDTGWHTVAWRMNFVTRQVTSVRYDGQEYPQFNHYFTYWPGYPTAATTFELNLTGPDGNDDIWEVDNIMVITSPVPSPIPIYTAKGLPDGQMVDVQGAMSAAFPNMVPPRLYIQEPGGRTGIQVRFLGQVPTTYASSAFSGQMGTDWSNHERYIEIPGYWNTTGVAKTYVVAMNARELGGGSAGLQEAVHNGTGVNNIGSLVRCVGRVIEKWPDNSLLYIADGSSLDDGSGIGALRVDLSAIPAGSRPNPAIGSWVSVTGISSMYKLNDAYHRLVRMRSSADLTVLAGAP